MRNQLKSPRSRNAGLIVAAGALLTASLSHADSMSDMLNAFKEGGKVSLDARTRYEYNKAGASEVNGVSLRTRLGYTTGEYNGFKIMLEAENLSFVDPDDRPALDVPVTELNQAWISYKGTKFGRQIVALDDHRFIGHVGWRQNIQTFDAITSSFAPSADSKLTFGYLNKVHRVNATTQNLDGFIGNGSYKFSENFSLTGFAYLLDFTKTALASSDTFGFRGTGKFALDTTAINYSFSYAKQQDNGGSVRDFDVDYFAAEVGTKLGVVTLSAGLEILGGDGMTGFTTPLATVHKFNGFADVFASPSLGLGGGLPHGLEDYYASIGFAAGPVPLTFSYHTYNAENVSETLGSEINAVGTYKVNEYVSLLAKFAKYESDGPVGVGYGTADKTVFTFEANLKY